MILKKTDEFTVEVVDDIKKFRSLDFNYNFNLKTGYTETWGRTEKDDPDRSPFGPVILDCEISTICNGVNGKLCDYCYKSNSPRGQNMSLKEFINIIEKVNYNQQLQQVAFGLGASGEENPDLWAMCDYLRSQHIIPNGTVASIKPETAWKIAAHFGAVAVSEHDSFEELDSAVTMLNNARNTASAATLRQINCHFMLAEETYDRCSDLFSRVAGKREFCPGLDAIVLLGVKTCGRAKVNDYHKLEFSKFKGLIKRALINHISIGFDSCSARKFEQAIIEIFNEPQVRLTKEKKDEMIAKYLQLSEPCESFGLFSSYVNVNGNYFSCSFAERKEIPMPVWGGANFETEVWNSPVVAERRDLSISLDRTCPYYDV